MKKLILIGLVVVMVASLGAGVAYASKQNEDGSWKGNGFPSGKHYELGLIGRPNNYTGGGTDNSNRHNIFLPLDTSGYVDGKVKLYMQQSADGFLVVDGDATSDSGVGEATFQIGPGYYAVFARALGKPGGNINFDAYFTYLIDLGLPSDAIWLGNVDLTRGIQKDGQWVGKKPQTVEISKLFYYTGCLAYGGTTVDPYTICYTNEWVFDILGFLNYWWDITNNGLKRLEIRFYPVEEGYVPPPLPTPE